LISYFDICFASGYMRKGIINFEYLVGRESESCTFWLSQMKKKKNKILTRI